MSKAIFRRDEFLTAAIELGATSIDLADYATTGLRVVTVGPSGIGKTNTGLVLAEQLAAQGWVSVLMDPEGEIAELYGRDNTMASAEKLENHLRGRHHPILVVPVKDTEQFIHYARVTMRVVDEERKPVFLVVDEGQVFSTSRRNKGLHGEASALLNDFAERGRKRALDLFVTTHRFSGTMSRSLFHNKNLTFVGRQEDPSAWSALAPQFKGSGVGFTDLAALAPGEFFMFSRRGVEKVLMPMADALAHVAPKARSVTPALPSTFSQWDAAMRLMPTERLRALTPDVVNILGAIAGLTAQQLAAGTGALREELEARG